MAPGWRDDTGLIRFFRNQLISLGRPLRSQLPLEMFDVLLLIVMLVVTWCVASEGAWGATLNFFAVFFAGLLAMNIFEPLAGVLESSFNPRTVTGALRADFCALVGSFAGFVFLLRFLTAKASPTFLSVHDAAYPVVRWGVGLLTGYVTMAFLCAAIHTAPLPRDFLNFKPERKNFFEVTAPDRQWLGFTQFVSERVLTNGRVFDGPVAQYANYPNTVWSSFPIRYAHRRAQQDTNAALASPNSQSEGGGSQKKAPLRGGENF